MILPRCESALSLSLSRHRYYVTAGMRSFFLPMMTMTQSRRFVAQRHGGGRLRGKVTRLPHRHHRQRKKSAYRPSRNADSPQQPHTLTQKQLHQKNDNKGYAPHFVEEYIEASVGRDALHVGELWVDLAWGDGVLEYDQDGARQKLCDWIDGTKGTASVCVA